jgi:hypothetical protein
MVAADDFHNWISANYVVLVYAALATFLLYKLYQHFIHRAIKPTMRPASPPEAVSIIESNDNDDFMKQARLRQQQKFEEEVKIHEEKQKAKEDEQRRQFIEKSEAQLQGKSFKLQPKDSCSKKPPSSNSSRAGGSSHRPGHNPLDGSGGGSSSFRPSGFARPRPAGG